jgi:hypothetical protein
MITGEHKHPKPIYRMRASHRATKGTGTIQFKKGKELFDSLIQKAFEGELI